MFVTVFLVVMIVGAVSVPAATGSTSGRRYYACVAGDYKTLNLTSAGATCPEGQRKISFGEGERGARGPAGPKGARGATGSKGARGAIGAGGGTGAEGKTGPTGPEGKAGAEGRQGPTGTGAPGPEGKQGGEGPAGPVGPAGVEGQTGGEGPGGPPGPQGPTGPPGEPGPEGPPGPPGPQGLKGEDGKEGPAGASGAVVYAASSGPSASQLTTTAAGTTAQVGVLPLDGVGSTETVEPAAGTLNLSCRWEGPAVERFAGPGSCGRSLSAAIGAGSRRDGHPTAVSLLDLVEGVGLQHWQAP